MEQQSLILPYLCLNSVAHVKSVLFRAQEQDADKKQANDDARCPQNEEKLPSFAVHQGHADDAHEEVEKREQHIAPMGKQIGQPALQQDVCVVSNDRVDAGF